MNSTHIDWDQLSAYLASHLPGGEDFAIQHASEIGTGWETDLYLVEGEASNQRVAPVVLRLYRGPQQQEQATREFRLMQLLGERGIPVPRVLLLALDDSPLGDAFVVMEYVRGPTLRQVFSQATESESRDLIRRMTALQLAIHHLPWQGLVESPLAADQGPEDVTSQMLSEMQETIRRYGLNEFEPHLRWLDDRRQQGAVIQISLIHNDYHPENLLVHNGELVVIDWAFAEASDYRLDLAWTTMLVGAMLGESHRALVLECYEQLDESEVECFQFFEVLKLTQRMLTIATWMDKRVQIPVHRITRQAIRGEYRVHVLNPYRRLRQITGLRLPSIEAL